MTDFTLHGSGRTAGSWNPEFGLPADCMGGRQSRFIGNVTQRMNSGGELLGNQSSFIRPHAGEGPPRDVARQNSVPRESQSLISPH